MVPFKLLLYDNAVPNMLALANTVGMPETIDETSASLVMSGVMMSRVKMCICAVMFLHSFGPPVGTEFGCTLITKGLLSAIINTN